VRSAPSTTASIVGSVAQGKVLDVVDVSGVWTKVTAAGVTGWVHNSLVEPVAAAPAASSGSKSAPPEAAAETPRAVRPSRSSASDSEKKLTLGVGASFGTDDIGIGAYARATYAPVASMPALRLKASFDYFFKDGAPWIITGGAQYTIRLSNDSLRPYVGAGLAYSHSSFEGTASVEIDGVPVASVDIDASGSSTNLTLEAGADIGKRFFAEGRIIVGDGSSLIFTGGVRF